MGAAEEGTNSRMAIRSIKESVMPLSRRAFLLSAAALPVWAVDVPRPSQDFSIDMPDGTKLPIKSFRGKVVALAFISTA